MHNQQSYGGYKIDQKKGENWATGCKWENLILRLENYFESARNSLWAPLNK